MTDNIDIKDGKAVTRTLATTDNAGVHTPHHRDPESIAALAQIHTDLAALAGFSDGLESLLGTSNTTLASILSALATSIAGYVDGLETLVTGSNTKLDAIHTDLATTLAGYVDGLETLATALNGYVDGLESQTGGLTETAPATDTASSGLNGRLQRIAQRLTTLIAGHPVFGVDGAAVASNANPLPVGGTGAWAEADATLTRPANATATVAHGSIGSASSCLFTFTNFFDVNGQHSLLDGMKMVIEKASIAVPSGIAIRVHLYQDDETGTVLSANADAATFKTIAAAAAKKIGYVDFTTWTIGGTGSDCIESYGVPVITSLHLKAASNSRNLYGIPEATAVYTPINAGIHHLYASRVGL